MRMENIILKNYLVFNKNCTYEDAPEQLDYLIKIFEESNLVCYEEFVSLLKHWRPEIINSFNRPYLDKNQSNALSEYLNKMLNLLINISKGYSKFKRFRAKAIYYLNDALFYHFTESLYSNKLK